MYKVTEWCVLVTSVTVGKQ